jgi:hemerythrin-like domain-containing protein
MAYRELLTEHIRKEDEILYPWMDRELSVKQVGELFSKFNEADDRMDRKGIERCEKFVLEVEKRFGKEEVK